VDQRTLDSIHPLTNQRTGWEVLGATLCVCVCVCDCGSVPAEGKPPHTGSKSIALCLGEVRVRRVGSGFESRGGSLPADVVDSEVTALDVKATEPASTDTAPQTQRELP
jgi:hypothetical protein